MNMRSKLKKKRDLVVEGKRIHLREIRLSDANKDYCRWMNDPEVNRFIESRLERWTNKKLRRYISKIKRNPDYLFFVIVLKSNGRHIGNIKIGPINRFHKFGDIGIIIGEKSYWGQGFAAEAIRLLSDFALRKLGLHKLTAGAYADNIGSIKAFRKAGFFLEGTRRSQYLSGGRYVDAVVVGKVRR